MFSHWMSSVSAASAAGNHSASNAPPADVLLDVGPPPYVRYAAHSALLSAHSGYLRSALRTPPPPQSSASHPMTDVEASASPIYLPSITADQFGPLLTYMYTGYLDLNVDNIFAVLLATHVLHMPRAAEICRTYLTRSTAPAQHHQIHQQHPQHGQHHTPAYAGEPTTHVVHGPGCRVVRPIASKAAPPPSSLAGGLPFAAPSMPTRLLLPSKHTPFKVLLQQFQAGQQTSSASSSASPSSCVHDDVAATSVADTADVTRCRSSPPLQPQPPSSLAANAELHTSDQLSPTGQSTPSTVTIGEVLEDPVRFDESAMNQHTAHIKPLSLSGVGGSKKTIIDIASCDGPVRFRRVLNEAYGLSASTTLSVSTTSMSATTAGHTASTMRVPVERSAQLVATSFHLQMAKNISGELRLRQQQQQQHERADNNPPGASESDESENSQQEINVSSEATNPEPPAPSPTAAASRSACGRSVAAPMPADELYVCVYCKHTFKSQYCFQKHAKRHINPLTIDDSELIVKTMAAAGPSEADADNPSPTQMSSDATGWSVGQSGRKATVVRREVRPLDMNVQYYPCKTCGSKFPSYYFVHKHRKLCHAAEDN